MSREDWPTYWYQHALITDGRTPAAKWRKLVIHALTNVLRDIPASESACRLHVHRPVRGIGGTRLGFEQRWALVFTSEYDDFCVKTSRQFP